MEKCPRSVHRGFKTAASSWSHSTVVLVDILFASVNRPNTALAFSNIHHTRFNYTIRGGGGGEVPATNTHC